MADARCVLLVRYRRPLYDDVTVMKSCVPRTLHAERRVSLRYERSRRADDGFHQAVVTCLVCVSVVRAASDTSLKTRRTLSTQRWSRGCARGPSALARSAEPRWGRVSRRRSRRRTALRSRRDPRGPSVSLPCRRRSPMSSRRGRWWRSPWTPHPPRRRARVKAAASAPSCRRRSPSMRGRPRTRATRRPLSEDANGAAHRVRGALVPERGRIDQALVDDMDAAVASALEGSDDKAAEPGRRRSRRERRGGRRGPGAGRQPGAGRPVG